MKLVTIDIETYWSQTHGLTKMNPLTYIMHPETELQSAAIKIDKGETFVLFGQELYDWLESYDFSDVMLVGHNMSGFDGPFLAFRYGVNPKMWGCTLAMARQCGFAKTVGGALKKVAADLGLGDKLDLEATNTKGKKLADFTPDEIDAMRTYNKVDTDLCYGTFKRLASKVGPRGLKLIDMTVRMLTEPKFEVDVKLLEDTLEEVKLRARKAILDVAETLDPMTSLLPEDERLEASKKILASAPKFARYLESRDVPVPLKPSPSNPEKLIPALAKTDQEFLELQEHPDEDVAMAVTARLGVKSTILETRLATFLEFARCANGKMPIFLNYYGADTTGRWSGGWKINHQNMPKIDPKKPKLSDALRNSLRAPKGYKVVVDDLSGIELRVNHFLWKVESSVKLYQESPDDADLYVAFASMLYDKDDEEVTKQERQLGKVCLLEGTPVLTDKGLVPIEEVTTRHRVWDGVEWVTHDGPIFNGVREVITYEEVTATPDHIVYLQDGSSCQLQEAADKNASIAITGYGAQAVRVGGDFIHRSEERKANKDTREVHELCSGEVDRPVESSVGRDRWLSEVQPAKTGAKVVGRAHNSNETEVYEPKRQGLAQLRGAWYSVQIRLRLVSRFMGASASWVASAFGVGQDKQRGALRAGQFAMGGPQGERLEQTWAASNEANSAVQGAASRDKVCQCDANESSGEINVRRNSGAVLPTIVQTEGRVWDILNAGPRHRFTANGKLVSNCQLGLGFGSGSTTFEKVAKNMGGIDLTRDESANVVAQWRAAYTEITYGWKLCHKALDHIYHGRYGIAIDPWGLCTTAEGGIKTPKGFIHYPDLRAELDENERNQWVYGHGRKKARIYGPKVVENIVQHLAREVICDMALAVQKRYPIVHTVHDELITIVPEAEAQDALDYMMQVMKTGVDWWPELITSSEGDIADTYGAAK